MKRQLLIVVSLGVLVSSCGSSTPSAPTPPAVTLTGVTVAGNASFTDRGQTSQLTAAANFSNGMIQDQTLAAAWASSNVAAATVSTTGVVTAVGTGTATITATFQNVQGTRAINVSVLCQINNTATLTIGNRSATASQAIVWDGVNIFTLTPGQTAAPITVAAGVAHSLVFRVANTATNACNASAPVLAQCANSTITCSGP